MKISHWTQRYGSIPPEILTTLKAAVQYLQSLTVDKITASIVEQSETIYNIALCRFYDFYLNVANSFLARVSKAKEMAKEKITLSKINRIPVEDDVIATSMIVPSEVNEKNQYCFIYRQEKT